LRAFLTLFHSYIPASFQKHIAGRRNLHAIIQNTAWISADRAMRIIMGLIVGSWVARYLGPLQYGVFSYVLAFLAFFIVISQLGLESIAIRDIANEKKNSPEILGTVIRLRLITGLFCWGIAILCMMLLRPGDIQSIALTAIIGGTLVFQASDTIDLWFQSQTQSKRTILSKAFSYFVSSGLKIILILINASLLYFAFVTLIEAMFSALALWISYRQFPTPSRWKWKTDIASQFLRESWPYLLSGLSIIVYMRIDQIMLREMKGDFELGIFSAALALSSAWYFIPTAICISVAPMMARRKHDNQIGYEKGLKQLFSLMWWILLPLSIGIAITAVPLVALLFGVAYKASAIVLAIHVFSNIPVGLGVVQSIWIINERKNTMLLYKSVMGAISNVLFNFILIPGYGAQGAAIATLISFSVSAVFSNIIFAPKIFKQQISSLFNL
jgi:PST family polysaccharide transporter